MCSSGQYIDGHSCLWAGWIDNQQPLCRGLPYEEVRRWQHGNKVRSVAFSLDGTQVLAGIYDKTALAVCVALS